MLRKLWLALEEMPGAHAALAEWRDRLGAGFASVRPLLLPTDKFAASLPVAGDGHATYRVVRHGPDDFVGVHDNGGPTITLAKDDVLIYRLDHQRVARNVVAMLGCDRYEAVIDGVPHAYQVGSYRPFAGFAFPVFFTLPSETADLQHTVELIASRHDEPFILLAPTRSCMQPVCESLIQRRKACFLPLSESIEMDNSGGWVVAAAAEQQLSRFRQAVVPQAVDAASAAFFPTPTDATWSDVRIKFIDGETVSIKVGSAGGTFVYSQLGMADGRNAKPTKQWELLRAFAKGYGAMNWSSPAADKKNQKRRETLARDLKSFFRIDGDPIEYVEETKGWRTVFTIEPDA